MKAFRRAMAMALAVCMLFTSVPVTAVSAEAGTSVETGTAVGNEELNAAGGNTGGTVQEDTVIEEPGEGSTEQSALSVSDGTSGTVVGSDGTETVSTGDAIVGGSGSETGSTGDTTVGGSGSETGSTSDTTVGGSGSETGSTGDAIVGGSGSETGSTGDTTVGGSGTETDGAGTALPEGSADDKTGEGEEPADVQLLSAQFQVVWENSAHSGIVPDISDDITVKTADGQAAADTAVALTDGAYTVSGLKSGQEYVLAWAPDAADAYTVAEEQVSLLYIEEEQRFAAEDVFTAALDTYDLAVQAVFADGLECPADFAVEITLNGAKVNINPENLGNGSYAFSGLFVVDGDYALQFPSVDGYAAADGYTRTANSQTSQPVTVEYKPVEATAVFEIYWQDDADKSGRRTLQSMEDMLKVYTVKNGVASSTALTGIAVTAKAMTSDLEGFEKYNYTLTGLPAGLGSNVSLRLVWSGSALPGYEGAYIQNAGVTLADGFEPMELTREQDAAVYEAESAWAFMLPEYEVTLKVNGLDAEAMEAFMAGIQVTLYDIEADAEIAYADYRAEQNEAEIRIHDLYTTYVSGDYAYPAYYTISWPEQISNFALDKEQNCSMRVGNTMAAMLDDAGDSNSQTAEITYYEKVTEYTASGTVSSSLDIVWYDTTAQYSHGGELELVVPVTITNSQNPTAKATFNFKPVWNSEQGMYVYNWTVADLKAFDLKKNGGKTAYSDEELEKICEQLKPLTITDTGENNLNRTLTAAMNRTVSVITSQYFETIDAESDELTFEVGNISVTDVNYEANGAEIQAYEIGKSQKNGEDVLTLYPMVKVTFDVEFRNGADPMDSNHVNQILNKVELWNVRQGDKTKVTSDDIKNAWGFDYNIRDNVKIVSSDDGSTYSVLLPLYDNQKKQMDYAITCEEVKTLVDSEGKATEYYYRVEYDNTNSAGHGTDTTKTYDAGKLILIRTGDTDFTFHKLWVDDGDSATAAARPQTKYTLWRYSENNGDYTSAAMVQIPISVDDEGKVTSYDDDDMGDIPTISDENGEVPPITIGNISGHQCLDEYDADGYRYVYFVREEFVDANSGYEKIFGQVVGAKDDSSPDIQDTLPLNYSYKDGTSRNADDHSIYDDGYITNRKTEPFTSTVTKSWNAAFYQDKLENVEVTLTLWAKHTNPKHGTGKFEVKTITLSDFDAFNTSQTVSVTVDRYGGMGHELVYWWEETSVTEGNEKVTVGAAAEEDGTARDPVDYQLPMNKETIALGGDKEDSYENFEAVVTGGEQNTRITNSLEGTTEYWVKKSWDESLTKTDVTFKLYQIDKDGNITEYGDDVTFTLKANSEYYHGTQISDWILPEQFKNLPLYDDNGNKISYIVKEVKTGNENFFPIHDYGKDADLDGTAEPNSVHVHNVPDGRVIDVRKVWLDDSATTDRAPVYFNVYLKSSNGVLVRGKDGNNIGLLNDADDETPYVVVTDERNWMEEVNVTVYTNGTEYAAEMPTGEAAEGWHLYEGDYYIKEMLVGTDAVKTDSNLTAAGYSTVKHENTTYAVIYNKATGSGYEQSSQYTDTVDEDGFYTVTNLRIGTVKLKVTKIWEDDGTIERDDWNAVMRVECTETYKEEVNGQEVEKNRVQTGNGTDTTNGYAKVHTAVEQSGWQAIYDNQNPKQQVALEQEVGTDENKITIYYNNLPLYDESGKILHYTVEEVMDYTGTAAAAGTYKISSSGLSFDDKNNTASEQLGVQTVRNTYQNTTDLEFYLLWLDQYRVDNQQRPDMYLKLYHTVYQYDKDGNPVMENGQHKYTIESYGFEEYLWSGVANQKVTGDFWKYTFSGLPEYDQHGQKITYYATVDTHVNEGRIDYLKPQYAEGKVDKYSTFISPNVNKATVTGVNGQYTVTNAVDNSVVGSTGTGENALAVLAQGNTFVLQLKNDVAIQGRKVWEQVPEGFPADNLPLLNFMLKRTGTTYKDELDQVLNAGTTGGTAQSTDYYIAAILNYVSPSTDYTFRMEYVGINVYDSTSKTCSWVDADTEIEYYDEAGNKKTATALKAWMEMAGITNETLARKYYGQPLPKYNAMGEMYVYTMVESYISPNNDAYRFDRVNISNSINDYNAVNTVISDEREITLTKAWTQNGSSIPEGFIYPDLEFKLYRFCVLENQNTTNEHTYSAVEQVGETVRMTGSQIKAANGNVTIEFGEQDIYAPNGQPFIYYVAETVINGYNNRTNFIPFAVDSGKANLYSQKAEIENWPSVLTNTGKNWYSQTFTLDKYNSDEAPVDQNSAEVTATNDYTALEQVNISGSKTWNDYGNAFGTRPESITLELYRSVTDAQVSGTKKEKIADITLKSDGKHSITKVSASVNITSATQNNKVLITNGTGSSNVWAYEVQNLDKYASNGDAWNYYVKEKNIGNGYTVTGSGTSLTNELYTSVEVLKEWKDASGGALNEELLYPAVKVELQVSTDSGLTWEDADKYFTGDKSLGANYTFERTLQESNHWRDIYEKLPVGYVRSEQHGPYGQQGQYITYKYRVREVSVLLSGTVKDGTWVDVEYSNYSNTTETGSFGAGGNLYTVTIVPSADGKTTTITNKVVETELTVVKKWQDSDNAYGTRYLENEKWKVDFKIYRRYGTVTEVLKKKDGSEYILTIQGTDSTSNEASATIMELPKFAPNGTVYEYYAVEMNPDDGQNPKEEVGTNDNDRYYGAYEVTSGSVTDPTDGTITNTITNSLELTQLAVTKNWVDDHDGQYFRPDTIDLTLYQESDKVKKHVLDDTYKSADDEKTDAEKGNEPIWNTDATNQWTATYVGLPKYDKWGNLYTYTVEEKQQSGYTEPDVKDGEFTENSEQQTTTITNTANKFWLEKYGFDTKINSDVLSPVTLLFKSTSALANTKTGNNTIFWLEWRKTDGGERYEIRYGDSFDNGTLWANGSTTGSKVDIVGLPDGTYQLTQEFVLPAGYWASALNRQFTLDNGEFTEDTSKIDIDTSTTPCTMKVADTKTTLTIQKLGKNGNSVYTIPDGWVFEITGEFTDSKGKSETREFDAACNPGEENADSWKGKLYASTASKTYIYSMKEKTNPAGFKLSGTTIYFKLDENNNVKLVNSEGDDASYTKAAVTGNILKFTDDSFSVKLIKTVPADTKPESLTNLRTYFKLYEIEDNGDKTYIKQLKTSKNGSYTLTSISADADSENGYKVILETGKTYRIEEYTAPAGYILPTNVPYVQFTINSDGTVKDVAKDNTVTQKSTKFTFTDDIISLKLTKYDLGDAYAKESPLAGVKFDVYASDGTYLGMVGPTGDNGEMTLTHIISEGTCVFPVGGKTYVLTETKVTGFEEIPNIILKVKTNGTIESVVYERTGKGSVEAIGDAGEQTSFNVTNERKLGKVALEKYTPIIGEGNYNLDNAEFKLMRKNAPGENFVDWITGFLTGQNYKVVWTSSGESTAKTPGWAKDLTVTNENGILRISDLPWGEYQLVETKAPNGFKLDQQVVRTFAVNADTVESEIRFTQNTSFEGKAPVENTPFSIDFYKYENGTDGEPLSGAEFTLLEYVSGTEGAEGHWSEVDQDNISGNENVYTSGSDGKITIDSIEVITTAAAEGSETVKELLPILKTGTSEATAPHYCLLETKAPEGYILPAYDSYDEHEGGAYIEFWINEAGEVQLVSGSKIEIKESQIRFVDDPLEIQLYKYDGGDQIDAGDVLANVEFTIKEQGASGNGTPIYTDAKGMIQFGPNTGVDGTDDYRLVGGKTYVLTETKVTGFEEIPDIILSVKTDGTIESVTYEETGKGSVEAIGDAGKQTSFKVTNERKLGKVALEKYIEIDEDIYDLNDAEFKLMRKNAPGENFVDWITGFLTGQNYKVVWTSSGESTAKTQGWAKDLTVTNENGILRISDLPWGEYQLVETKAPNGFKLDRQVVRSFTVNAETVENEIRFTLDSPSTGKEAVENAMFSIDFYKYENGTDGEPLSGAEFTLLEYVSGTEGAEGHWSEVDKDNISGNENVYTSGSDGKITIDSIEVITTAAAEGSETVKELLPILKTGTSEATAPHYCLLETKAPEGYILPAYKSYDKHEGGAYIEFWINEAGVVQPVSGRNNKIEIENSQIRFVDDPLALQLIKYDGGDRATKALYQFVTPSTFTDYDNLAKLGDVTFTLTYTDSEGNTVTQTKATGTESETDRETGVITFGPAGKADFAIVGGVTYTLTEEDVEDRGYVEVNSFRFKVETDGSITFPDGETIGVTKESETNSTTGAIENTFRIVNKRNLGSVTLEKTTTAGDALDGAVFRLYLLDQPEEEAVAQDAGQSAASETWIELDMDFVTGKTYKLTGDFTWTGSKVTVTASDYTVTENAGSGILKIEDLDWGVYKLVETKAEGYILAQDETTRTHRFTISNDDPVTTSLYATVEVTNEPNRLHVQKVEDGTTAPTLKGAVYELYQGVAADDGTTTWTQITNTTDDGLHPMWNWDSEAGTGNASCLPTGDYKLVETRSPYGYVIADDLYFHMDQDGTVKVKKTENGETTEVTCGTITLNDKETPVIYAEDLKTKFTFTKTELFNESCYKEASATRILPGVTFTAYEDEELTKEITKAVSDENGVVTFIGLPLKDYLGEGTSTPVYIKETATVSGHVLDETVYLVYVESSINAEGEVESNCVLMKQTENVKDNTVINDVFRADFSFTKVSELNNAKAIPGGVYGLYKTVYKKVGPITVAEEVLVAEAESGGDGTVVFKGLLMDVEYTVKELYVPTGSYLSSESISFKYVWENGKAVRYILDDGDGTITQDDGQLLWQEPQIVIKFRKVDEYGTPLMGATLQIKDSNGKVVPVIDQNGKKMDSWVTDGTDFVITGQLKAGETYWLCEVQAPAGYYLADPVEFKVPHHAAKPGEARVVQVTLENILIPVIKQEDGDQNGDGTGYPGVNTGDDTPVMGYLGLMCMSCLILIALAATRKKKEESEGA